MDKFHIKAQGAMEFMLLAGVLLFVFVIMLTIISNQTSYLNKKRDIITGEEIVTKVQKEINLAARVLDGYYREFKLPQKLGNINYNISIIGGEVIIRTAKQDFWRVIPSVVGEIRKETNIINKTDGVIYLN